MTKEEERQYWPRVIQELRQAGYSLDKIAIILGASLRQVENWKAGHRPTGLWAVRLYEARRDIVWGGKSIIMSVRTSGESILS